MRRSIITVLTVSLISSVLSLSAQSTQSDSLRQRVEKLEKREEKLEQLLSQFRNDPQRVSTSTNPRHQEKGGKEISQPADPKTFRVYWKDGIRLDLNDQQVRLQLGGRTMNDWAFLSGDPELEQRLGPLKNGVEFRQVRLHVMGEVDQRMEFSAEYDFAGGQAKFKDVYAGLRRLPGIGKFLLGHFKEPFSLDELTSSRFITFLERSLASAFVPSRNTGAMVQNTFLNQQLNWAGGVFRNSGSFGGSSGDDNYSFTTRLTGLPWYEGGGQRLLHLGLAYSHRNQQDDLLHIRERPEAHLAQRFVNTGQIRAPKQDLLGLEAALVVGPWSLQGELIQSFVDSENEVNPTFSGLYVQGSYFLSGEYRRYKQSSAAFDRVRPATRFGREDGGVGAWEVAVRYSRLDLTDQAIQGGELNNFTLGLNWYLNPNVRVMWNYVLSKLHSVGDANILQTRFQFDF